MLILIRQIQRHKKPSNMYKASRTSDLQQLLEVNQVLKLKETSRSKNNQAFKIKKGMSMSVQMAQEQDGETSQDED
ncbi:hypothetical protein Tco_1119778 [Tanacetum coccineum]